MSGNISNTYINETEGMKTFIKKVPVDKFDTRSLTFQSNLRQYIKGAFNINHCGNIKVVTDGGTGMFYEIEFEYLDEKPWRPNSENMKLIGTSMAIIHNHSYRNKNQITLNSKRDEYSRIENWNLLSNDIPFKTESQERRREIFKELNLKLDTTQPKIPLHRDFKPHNIIFDGDKYHLIDFDFAAIDYVSLEVIGFVVDIIDSGLGNVKTFLEAYLDMIDIKGIKPLSFVDDYLAYLCTNTFPFYMNESLESDAFKNLVEHRNNSLETLYHHRHTIQQMIEKFKHENI